MSDSDESDIVPVKRKKKYNIEESEDYSSNDSSPILHRPAKRVKVIFIEFINCNLLTR